MKFGADVLQPASSPPPQTLRFRGRLRLDPDAQAIISAVGTASGVSVTTAQKKAIQAFIRAEKVSTRFAALKRLYIPIWGNAAANAVDWITRASGTWVGGVTHAAGYVQSDGSTGYLNTGLSPAAASMSATSALLGALRTEAFGSGTLIGSMGPSVTLPVRSTEAGGSHYFDFTNFVGGRLANTNLDAVPGILTCRAFGSALTSRARNSTGLVASATATAGAMDGVNSNNIFVLGENNNGTLANPCADRVGAAFFGTAMSDAADAAFTLNLKTLWETLTGQQLPPVA
jgi:hypothetical protein